MKRRDRGGAMEWSRHPTSRPTRGFHVDRPPLGPSGAGRDISRAEPRSTDLLGRGWDARRRSPGEGAHPPFPRPHHPLSPTACPLANRACPLANRSGEKAKPTSRVKNRSDPDPPTCVERLTPGPFRVSVRYNPVGNRECCASRTAPLRHTPISDQTRELQWGMTER